MIKYTLFLFGLLITHLLLVYSGILPGVLKQMMILDGALGSIFLISMFIVSKRVKGDAENFVWRFLIITTFQLLASLTVIIVLFFKHKNQALTIGLSGTAIALILLIAQSFVLLKFSKTS